MQNKIRWTIAGLVGASAIAGSLIFAKIDQFKAMGAAAEQMVMPPLAVNVLPVREEQRQPTLSAVGSVKAIKGTTVSTEADGIVRSILFEAGAHVDAGTPLLQLDVALEDAQLRAAEAAAASARVVLTRAQELRRSNSVSQADIDMALSNHKQAEAQADYMRALIAKKTVRAPFSGKLGLRNVSEGDFLEKGRAIVSLQALEAVYLEFSLPQQRLAQLRNGLTVLARTDAYPAQTFTGEITAIHPEIDMATRHVRLQATLPNPEARLRPGMFMSLQVQLDGTRHARLVPETGILHGPHGNAVFVLGAATATDAGDTYELALTPVKLGERSGDFVEVIDGLRGNERIVSTGVFKLQPGMKVIIDQRLAPVFSTTPTPDNT